ncbi:MAG: glycosyltransferase family 1 protein [Pseudomonadota bacterium]
MTRIILYDVGRFLNRAKAPTPTGIDRVDIRYLQHFLTAPDTKVIGVVQKGKVLIAVPDRQFSRLWRLLSARWIEGLPAVGLEKLDQRWLKLSSSIRTTVMKLTGRSGASDSALVARSLQRLRHDNPEAEILYVNSSHNGIKAAAPFRFMRDTLGAACVFYIHDMIPTDYPDLVRAGAADRHSARMRLVLNAADLVLTNSTYSQDRIAAFASKEALPLTPIEVLHIGVEPSFLSALKAQGAWSPSETPHFVTVGTIEPRKNLSVLLKAWKLLKAGPGPTPQLKIIGRRGWFTEANADYPGLLEEAAPEAIETGALDDGQLLEMLLSSRALLFPSFVEGWGMPIVEALTASVPVIASDIDAFREASQGFATLLPAEDSAAWANAVRQAASVTPPADLSGFKPPTWPTHFEKLEQSLGRLRDTFLNNRAGAIR